MTQSFRTRLIVAVLCLTTLGTACYGPFNLTRRLHEFNHEVDDEPWIQEGIFLIMAYIPVYALCMIGDALIFNSIEFWGGENPISPPDGDGGPASLGDDDDEGDDD